MNFTDIFTKKYMNGFYRRNKTVINLSIILCIIFFIAGLFLFDINQLIEEESLQVLDDYDEDVLEEGIDRESLLADSNMEGFINLFIHNFLIDTTVVLGGILISIPSVIITAYNVSMFGGIFANLNILMLITAILPHGIFEMPSSLFALIGGLMITQLELRIIRGILSSHSTLKYELNNSQRLLADILLTVIIIFLLLTVAAFIETFITPYLVIWTLT